MRSEVKVMRLIVLGDGETYNGISGCLILHVPNGFSPEQIEELLDNIRRSNPELAKEHIVTELH